MNPDLRRRLRVLRLRQRVEGCSWRIYTACLALPNSEPHHTRIADRLLLLIAWTNHEYGHDRLRRTIAELTWVYAQCCDVLHGRRAFTDLPEPLVRAWERTVDDGEIVVSAVTTGA